MLKQPTLEQLAYMARSYNAISPFIAWLRESLEETKNLMLDAKGERLGIEQNEGKLLREIVKKFDESESALNRSRTGKDQQGVV